MEICLHIIQKQQAKSAKLHKYFTGIPCKRGHYCERLTCNSICLLCARDHNKTHYQSSMKEKRNTPSGILRRRLNDKNYLNRNHDDVNKRRRLRYAERREEMLERRRRYYNDNLPKILASNALIRLRRMQRAPAWLTDAHIQEIEKLYHEAARLSVETGIKHHVDHIVPLLGRKVSGLHVPWNMQVIPAKDNLRKGNKFVPA